jgi:hypothetical protein
VLLEDEIEDNDESDHKKCVMTVLSRVGVEKLIFYYQFKKCAAFMQPEDSLLATVRTLISH